MESEKSSISNKASETYGNTLLMMNFKKKTKQNTKKNPLSLQFHKSAHV